MIQQLNVNKSVRREFPHWNAQGRIKKVDQEGNVVEGQYAFGGELVRISPRFQKHGTNYRVRPERPAAFFAEFLFENGLLPTALTAEECEQEWALELLDPLWETYKGYFPKLESPYAACDLATTPSHRLGFSFNLPQILVEETGLVRTNVARPAFRPVSNGSVNGSVFAQLKKRIDEERSRSAGRQEAVVPKKKG